MNIDTQNNDFWSELCGSHAARRLGVTDDSAESLRKFDTWYMNFYPYLHKHLPQGDLTEKKVLEIGLGYGTVSSILMAGGADYTGCDVAAGPVSMNQHRAKLLGVAATSIQGSACDLPFEDGTFDYVVSIGCLHHTGNLPLAIREVERVLRPGGQSHLMVYNALSYRQWVGAPFATRARRDGDPQVPNLNSVNDVRYDSNAAGDAAPETVYVTEQEIRLFFGPNTKVTTTLENIGNEGPLRLIPRSLKNRVLGPRLGLDLYVVGRKAA